MAQPALIFRIGFLERFGGIDPMPFQKPLRVANTAASEHPRNKLASVVLLGWLFEASMLVLQDNLSQWFFLAKL